MLRSLLALALTIAVAYFDDTWAAAQSTPSSDPSPSSSSTNSSTIPNNSTTTTPTPTGPASSTTAPPTQTASENEAADGLRDWLANRFAPVLFSGLVSVLIALGVALYSNKKAAQRWQADSARADAARAAEWIREATAEALRAAQVWRAAIIEGGGRASEQRERWETLSRELKAREAEHPEALESLRRAKEADEAHQQAAAARDMNLRQAVGSAEARVRMVEEQLTSLPAAMEKAARASQVIVDQQVARSMVAWIQAKGLAEVLAPDLHDSLSKLESAMQTYQWDIGDPSRRAGRAMADADAAFAAMLASARKRVETLLSAPVATASGSKATVRPSVPLHTGRPRP